MANKAGFNAAAVGGILRHYNRERDENGQYQEYPRREGGGHIDPTLTQYNYSIRECHSEEWIRERLKGVYQRPQDRGKKPVMLDVVVTLPQDEPEDNAGEFFEAAYGSLESQFGRNNNIVGAWVHMDEARPHMHFAFLPVVQKSMKSRPDVTEGISQAAYFPKKSALRTMHETLQKDISTALGHRVAILNGATKTGNKTITELKAQTAREIKQVGKDFTTLKEIAANIEKGKRWGIVGDTTYMTDGETMGQLLRMAQAGAHAVIVEREREQAVTTAQTREQQANRERMRAERERDESIERMERIQDEAAIYLHVPEHLKGDVNWAIENTRQQYRDYADTINRRVCRAFLCCGRDIKATKEAMGKELESIGIQPKDQWQYIKQCLAAVSRQAHMAKHKGEHKPPARGNGWSPAPKETDYGFIDAITSIIPSQEDNAAMPSPGTLSSSDDEDIGDWNLLSEFAKEEILWKRFVREYL